ncbi:MAG: Glycosyl transferase family 2, partial [Parcubacteria group bacterium GW2011_GWB1_57_6]
MPDMLPSYPYVRMVKTNGKLGAGAARNLGAKHARAPLLLFLDADDNLLSNDALRRMVDVWNTEGAIVYSDYVHKAYINPDEAVQLNKAGRLIYRDEKSNLCMVKAHAEDYDCSRAVKQPEPPFYIWNLITSLVPKVWHDEIGGFDETMPSWEDWVYWLCMARAGKCFVRIAEPLVAYRFYTGGRRDAGIQMHKDLIQYIISKLKDVPSMGCKCGGKKLERHFRQDRDRRPPEGAERFRRWGVDVYNELIHAAMLHGRVVCYTTLHRSFHARHTTRHCWFASRAVA